MTHEVGLVIFDCDGVLVDSERLAISTERAVLERLGWTLSEAEIVERFAGRSAAYMHSEVERHIGHPIDWSKEFDSAYKEAYVRELEAVEGVRVAIDAIPTSTCVASSSTLSSVTYKLTITGLIERFRGRIYTSDDVERAKPAPDLFLLAASTMGHPPSRCAVIEDSVPGVVAAKAAGMKALGFTGSVTSASALAEAGAITFASMADLPDLLFG